MIEGIKGGLFRRLASAKTHRPLWYVVVVVALTGWSIAGFISFALVAHIGWFGILTIGIAILFVAVNADLQADPSAIYAARVRQYYGHIVKDTTEGRLAKRVERVERNRWLYIVRTIGIAMALLGGNMFVLHQL
jgi:hypothetical protein